MCYVYHLIDSAYSTPQIVSPVRGLDTWRPFAYMTGALNTRPILGLKGYPVSPPPLPLKEEFSLYQKLWDSLDYGDKIGKSDKK